MSNAAETGEKTTGPKADRIIEPEIVPTHVINSIYGGGYFGSLFDVILAESRIGYNAQGDMEGQALIVARLRFDRDFARTLHTQLGNMLSATEAPPKDKVN
jgi:hypothetical protein